MLLFLSNNCIFDNRRDILTFTKIYFDELCINGMLQVMVLDPWLNRGKMVETNTFKPLPQQINSFYKYTGA